MLGKLSIFDLKCPEHSANMRSPLLKTPATIIHSWELRPSSQSLRFLLKVTTQGRLKSPEEDITSWFILPVLLFVCFSLKQTKIPQNQNINYRAQRWGLPWLPTVKTSLSNTGGVSFWSLVGKLRSHMPHGQKKIKYCNNFSKDSKKIVHI